MFIDAIAKEITKKFFEAVFPAKKDRAIQNREQLITNILKMLSIIDAYSFECQNFKNILQSNLLNYNSYLFDIKTEDSIKRLDYLCRKLGRILLDIKVIRFYDKELSNALKESYSVERSLGWHPAFDSFLISGEGHGADSISKLGIHYSSTKKQINIINDDSEIDFSLNNYSHKPYSSYDLGFSDQTSLLIDIINDLQNKLRVTSENIENFIKSNFDLSEVYGLRKRGQIDF